MPELRKFVLKLYYDGKGFRCVATSPLQAHLPDLEATGEASQPEAACDLAWRRIKALALKRQES